MESRSLKKEIEDPSTSSGFSLLGRLVAELTKKKFITHTLAEGDTKFLGVCKAAGGSWHRRLDLRLLQLDHCWCGILYYTGSEVFNRRMRRHAKRRGFLLNEYDLRVVSKEGQLSSPLPITSEEDIFDYIGFPYVPPEDRSY